MIIRLFTYLLPLKLKYFWDTRTEWTDDFQQTVVELVGQESVDESDDSTLTHSAIRPPRKKIKNKI